MPCMINRPVLRSAISRPRRFAVQTRAGVSIEGVLSVSLLVAALASVLEIVHSMQTLNRVEQVAWAIARSNAVTPAPAANADELKTRNQDVIYSEVGRRLDPEDFQVTITAYATPSDLASGTSTGKPSAELGGDPNELVYVRVRYNQPASRMFGRLVGGNVVESVALTQNQP